MEYNYVVVEGNIGAGKTTLATMLAEHYNTSLVLEQFEDNFFLPEFYKHPEKYALPLELSFVADRYQQLRGVFSQPDLFKPQVISDYFILKSLIFAKVNLPELEFSLFEKLYRIVYDALPLPDLMIFLNSGIERLKRNIHLRGRGYEMNIKDEYLNDIHLSYVSEIKAIQDFPVLLIDSDTIDFVQDPSIFNEVIELLGKKHKKGINFINF